MQAKPRICIHLTWKKITVPPARNKPLSQSAGLWRKKPSATETAKKPIKLMIHTRMIAAHGAP